MRTPTAMIVGLVVCPCGLLLMLTGTLAPSWRQVSLIPNKPIDLVLEQGLWDICREQLSSHDRRCSQADELGYFEELPVRVAQWLMPTSLVLTFLGLVVAALGVRCWQKEPRHLLAGIAGLVLLLPGLLSLVPASWYTHELWALPAPAGSTLAVGYSLVLSYLGSCMEILGGLALTLSFHHCCKERRAPKLPPSSVLDAGPCSTREAYCNPWDVLEGEGDGRDGQQWRSSLPCDSDL
ncbi:claudin-23 [Morus bassanus]